MKCLEVNFRQCTYCLQNVGITCIAYSFSPLHEMPDIFRIACNIYTYRRVRVRGVCFKCVCVCVCVLAGDSVSARVLCFCVCQSHFALYD